MAILSSEHLLAQADGLLSLFPGRKPRQIEIRRAVFAAYYAAFHYVLKEAADEYVGARYGRMLPPAPEYALAYRAISHAALHALCSETRKPKLPDRFKASVKAGVFGSDLRVFSGSFVDLQERRHSADYDLSAVFNRAEAISAIALARTSIQRFESAVPMERRIFLALLLFPPRGKA